MSDRIIIEHKDGRTYSVTPETHKKLYPDFKVVGKETPEAFVATGIPVAKAPRSKPAAKNAKPIVARKATPKNLSPIDAAVAEAEAAPDAVVAGGKVATAEV